MSLDLTTKKELVKKASEISINVQLGFLNLSKASFYSKPKEISQKDQRVMQSIFDIYSELPFYGHRRIWEELKELDILIGRDKTLKLMRNMGLKAIYPEPKTTLANKEHKTYPYLLKKLDIERPNQVWATDITYLKTSNGHMYFVAVIDWYSRKILSYRISNTLETSFCIDALNEAICNYGIPEIFNSDQGSQFTSTAFTDVLKKYNINISMDSVGRWADNIIIERFFRTLKYEDIYLRKYPTVKEMKLGVAKYIVFYNDRRKHSSLKYTTPNCFYEKSLLSAA